MPLADGERRFAPLRSTPLSILKIVERASSARLIRIAGQVFASLSFYVIADIARWSTMRAPCARCWRTADIDPFAPVATMRSPYRHITSSSMRTARKATKILRIVFGATGLGPAPRERTLHSCRSCGPSAPRNRALSWMRRGCRPYAIVDATALRTDARSNKRHRRCRVASQDLTIAENMPRSRWARCGSCRAKRRERDWWAPHLRIVAACA